MLLTGRQTEKQTNANENIMPMSLVEIMMYLPSHDQGKVRENLFVFNIREYKFWSEKSEI